MTYQYIELKLEELEKRIEALEQEPSGDTINRQAAGKWHIAHGMYEDRFWCSCGYIRIMDSGMNEWKFCPVCGGERMVEEKDG